METTPKGGRIVHQEQPGFQESGETVRKSLVGALYSEGDGKPPDWLDTTLLRSGEVALLFQVSRRTVIQWARAGKLPFITTPGGHRRYRARDVRALLERATSNRPPAPLPRTAGAARPRPA